jgi:hypothetical protein
MAVKNVLVRIWEKAIVVKHLSLRAEEGHKNLAQDSRCSTEAETQVFLKRPTRQNHYDFIQLPWRNIM